MHHAIQRWERDGNHPLSNVAHRRIAAQPPPLSSNVDERFNEYDEARQASSNARSAGSNEGTLDFEVDGGFDGFRNLLSLPDEASLTPDMWTMSSSASNGLEGIDLHQDKNSPMLGDSVRRPSSALSAAYNLTYVCHSLSGSHCRAACPWAGNVPTIIALPSHPHAPLSTSRPLPRCPTPRPVLSLWCLRNYLRRWSARALLNWTTRGWLSMPISRACIPMHRNSTTSSLSILASHPPTLSP